MIWEIVIVLALSLGKSGVNALINLLDLATRGPISEGTANLNGSASSRPWIDLSYQVSGLVFALAPVALVLWLLARNPGSNPARLIGLDGRRPGGDAWRGMALFVVVGAGTLGVYAAGRALGITTAIQTNGLGEYWWSIPILLLSALKNGLLEEIVVVGYLVDRLERLGMKAWWIIVLTAVLRGSYHLYQGIGPFIGNVAMGVIFTAVYLRYRRVMPLVVAHVLLDAVGFIGYPLLAQLFGYGS
jgi:membrane protease YdiL (CAAX protease family)